MRLTLLLLLVLSARARGGEPAVSFSQSVAPLLKAHCLGCHAGDRPKGGVNLARESGLREQLTPGEPLKSVLLQQVRDGKMPPKKPLTPQQVELLQRWVAAGATWEGGDLAPATTGAASRAGKDWWSLRPIGTPEVPPSEADTSNPIDAFLHRERQRRGVSASPPADRRTLLRRVTLDLTGLLPTPEAVDEFERDPRPDAYERRVDALLASPAHGETWARHWLDVVRFAESHGYEMNSLRPNAWHYRDYVIRAINQDLPFREFVRDQLAGDTHPDAGRDPLRRAATGFLVAGPHDLVGDAIAAAELQKRSNDLFDMVSTTATSFLGLTVGCARCHDHKFDPIPQRDYYALEAFFSGVEHGEAPLPRGDASPEQLRELEARIAQLTEQIDAAEPVASPEPGPRGSAARRTGVRPERNVERIAPTRLRFLRLTVLRTSDGTEPCIDEIEAFAPGGRENLALASRGVKPTASSEYPGSTIHKIAHINDGLFGNPRSWISHERGAGWVQLEWPEVLEVGRLAWARDREGKFRDRTPVDYRFEASLDGKQWTTLCGGWDRAGLNASAPVDATLAPALAELAAARERLARLRTPPVGYVGTFRAPGPTRLLRRGDVLQPDQVVTPGGLSALPVPLQLPADAGEAARRQALADWIASPQNPLPARVLVNRLWHYHFGQGLVRTPSDFGFNGDRPSHPELLDFLAAEFLRNGGHAKPIHRLIVTSRAYRQGSRIDPAMARIDADNRLLWRFGSRRLEAEKIRDAVVQVSGALRQDGGGPGYHLWDYSGYVTVFTPKETLGPEALRRMVYQFKPRSQADRTFGAFDCPDGTGVTPKRAVSTTPLQALNLLNDGFMLDQAGRLAERIQRDAGGEPERQAELAFRLVLLRSPAAGERAGAADLVRRHGLMALCRALLNCNEFVTLE